MSDAETDYRLLIASREQLTVDTVADYQIRALRTVAFSRGEEQLADACTVAIGVTGQTDEDARRALETCVEAINGIRVEAARK